MKRDEGETFGMVWREGREGRDAVIIISKKFLKICKLVLKSRNGIIS